MNKKLFELEAKIITDALERTRNIVKFGESTEFITNGLQNEELIEMQTKINDIPIQIYYDKKSNNPEKTNSFNLKKIRINTIFLADVNESASKFTDSITQTIKNEKLTNWLKSLGFNKIIPINNVCFLIS